MVELVLTFLLGFVLGIAVSIIGINIFMAWQNKNDKGDTC